MRGLRIVEKQYCTGTPILLCYYGSASMCAQLVERQKVLARMEGGGVRRIGVTKAGQHNGSYELVGKGERGCNR
jgi:hypothetical protein